MKELKELFKINVIYNKMRKNCRPVKNQVNLMMLGKTHTITPAGIDNMIEIVNKHHEAAIAFLNAQKPTTK